MSLELEIQKIIEAKFAELNRPDLIRTPIVAFSSAHDPKFAALKEIIGPWHQLPTDFLPEAESVISYFIPFTREVALGPKNEPDGCPVWSEAYITINQHFHVVNQAVQDYLESQGYKAAQIRPPKAYDPETFHAVWSHRSAAVISVFGFKAVLLQIDLQQLRNIDIVFYDQSSFSHSRHSLLLSY